MSAVRVRPSGPMIKEFHLYRVEDESGISGVGVVAEGVQLSNGKCIISWLTEHTSITVYDSIEEVDAIHGHNGKTHIHWGPPD